MPSVDTAAAPAVWHSRQRDLHGVSLEGIPEIALVIASVLGFGFGR